MIILKKKVIKKNGGFIALMSAIIMSVILLLLMVNLSFTGFYNRFNILYSELKEKSSALAEACADTVLLKLASDSMYIGGGAPVVVSGSDTCTIDATSPTTPTRTFTLHAIYNNSYTNLQIIVNTTTLAVTRWEEIP